MTNRSRPAIRGWLGLGVIAAASMAAALIILRQQSVSGRPILDLFLLALLTNLAFYVWIRAGSRLALSIQWTLIGLLVGLQGVGWALFRWDGLDGDGRPLFTPRWLPSPYERFAVRVVTGLTGDNEAMVETRWVTEDELRGLGQTPLPEPPQRVGEVDLRTTRPGDIPSFRGPDRDGVIDPYDDLAIDWETSPPRFLWRQPIGAGWSSFAVVNGFAVTLEQRGSMECTTCYEVTTGRQAWVHAEEASFKEFSGGPGPRATPAVFEGRVYSLGATGVLLCLEGSDGTTRWRRQILDDARTENRLFGMAGSPLVVNGRVIVTPGGPHGAVAAYDARSGDLLWSQGAETTSYSSPHAARLAGRDQVLHFAGEGIFSHDLNDGRLLWSYPWVTNPPELNNVCQPVPWLASASGRATDAVLLSSGYGRGSVLLDVTENSGLFRVAPRWRSRGLKAKFTSIVTRDDFVYGLDDGILVCLEMKTGERAWKGGRHGHGQLLRLGGVLLVQEEFGGIALVEATPKQYRLLARFNAFDHRVWAQPVVVRDHLLIRSDREAGCIVLPRQQP